MDIEAIYQRMKSAVESGSGVHLSERGDMSLRLYAVAAEIYSLWVQAGWLEKQSFPQTAAGEFLDRHAALRGLERRSGTQASGSIRFELSEVRGSATVIPAGTVCLNASGLEFLTDEQGTIPAGSLVCELAATARDAGSFGNVPADSVYVMALAPVGVARCYNPLAFSGGTDPETDESLRSRVLGSYARLPNGSNVAYYEAEALNTDGVAAACVLPRNRGIGTVDVVISSADGVPTQAMITSLQERLAQEREICVDVKVLAPSKVTVNVTVTIEVESGFDGAAVAAEVKSAIGALFDGRLLGKKLLRARIGQVVYGVAGVSNYTINAPSSDVAISTSQLPVAGTITVNRS